MDVLTSQLLRALDTTERVLAALRAEPEQDDPLRNLMRAIERDRAMVMAAVVSGSDESTVSQRRTV